MAQNNAIPTLLDLGSNVCAVAKTDRVSFLVDGKAYFEAFTDAAERAERSIIILAWDFDSRTRLRCDQDAAKASRPRQQQLLGDFLNAIVRRRRSLHVRVLNWDYPVIFGSDRELPPVYGLSWQPHRRAHLRYDGTHPLAGSQHQKIVVIDDKLAFVGGLDLTCKRWDTPEHRPGDPRRVSGGKPYPPFHDLMVAVDGEAARELAKICRDRWHVATGEKLQPVSAQGDPWPASLPVHLGGADIGISCTYPEGDARPEVRHVERLYLDMIARAKRHIYIENQYFTSHRVGEAIAARLAEPDGPEIVLVTRLLSHGWLEEITMHVLRSKLVRDLRAADRHQRFHVYYPHIQGLEEGTCVDVHSKMMAVDDQWLRIGSANLSNRSMGLDTECDIVIEARGEARVSEAIRGFRDGLIAEHTASSLEQVRHAIAEAGSMHGAIPRLGTAARGLRRLEDQEYSDALVAAMTITDPERPVSLERLVEQLTPESELKAPSSARLKIVTVILVLLALTLVWRFTPAAEWLTAENVTAFAETMSQYWWAPLALVALYTPATFTMFPRPLLTLSAGVAFGPWLGFTYAMTGILLAAGITYYLGRIMKRETVRRIAGERLNRLSLVLQKRGLVAMAAIRLVPLAPFIVENIVAGAFRIKLFDFFAGTFIGMLPGALTATVFGGQLEAALTDPSKTDFLLLGGAIALMVGAAFYVRGWLAKLEKAQGENAQRKQASSPGKRTKGREKASSAQTYAE